MFCSIPDAAKPGTEGLREVIEGGVVEKYWSTKFFCGFVGDSGLPFWKSENGDKSSANGFGVICGGAIIARCHTLVVAAGLFEPSNITSLIPLWLAVLIAEGEDPSTALSVLVSKDI